jgi:hypothetical protein
MIINTRKDYDALPADQQAQFKQFLQGTLWRIERDDPNQTYVAIEDNSTIERFGFSRADFPDAQPPELPEWIPEPRPVYTCSPWQIRKALLNQGLRQTVEDAVAASTDYILKDGWEYASAFVSNDPFVISMGSSLGMDQDGIDNLIQYAATL